MSSKTTPKNNKEAEAVAVLYDADARNRFGYNVIENGKKYKTAAIFEALTDERYLQWVREFKIRGNDDDVNEESREASIRLWDDIVSAVENIEVPEGEDFHDIIPYSEKIQGLNEFLAIAVFDPDEEAEDDGVRRPAAVRTQTVITEAFFNGQITRQTHVLKEKTLEWEKKYSRIQAKRFKQETTRGLRRKPKVEFVPQDAKIGEMYDEMVERTAGFAGRVPLRFKTAVISHVFDATFEAEEKK